MAGVTKALPHLHFRPQLNPALSKTDHIPQTHTATSTVNLMLLSHYVQVSQIASAFGIFRKHCCLHSFLSSCIGPQFTTA